jgi:hypothetical protein
MAVDLRIGDYISKDQNVSAGKLATALGVDPTLLVRIMRVLMTKHVFKESQPGFYSHTAMSWAMQKPNMQDLLLHRLDDSFRSASRQPDALRLNGYQNPLPCGINGFNLAFDTKGTFWDYVHEPNSERGARFNRAMKAVNINRLADIPLLYPFASLAEHGGLIVDVGGGLGQVGREILLHNPDAALHCVVQDLLVDPAIDNKEKTYSNGNGNMENSSSQTNTHIPEPALHSTVQNVLVDPAIDHKKKAYTNGKVEGSSSHDGLCNSEAARHSDVQDVLVYPAIHSEEKTYLNGLHNSETVLHSMVENVLVDPAIDKKEETYTNGNIEGSSSHNGLHNPVATLHSDVQDVLVDSSIHSEEKTYLNGNVKNSSSKGHEPDLAITMQHHNFFDPQPIKGTYQTPIPMAQTCLYQVSPSNLFVNTYLCYLTGAAAYFFRHIFHDWPDNDCITILQQTASAMDIERSRILICDQLMLDKSPSTPSILYDLDMMALFGGKERNMMEVHTLIKRANKRLYISDIQTSPKSSTTIIEVRLAPMGDLDVLCQQYCVCSKLAGERKR